MSMRLTKWNGLEVQRMQLIYQIYLQYIITILECINHQQYFGDTIFKMEFSIYLNFCIKINVADLFLYKQINKISFMKKGGKDVKDTKKPEKVAEKKPFSPKDYVTFNLGVEEVIQIKQAFDSFDSDRSGIVQPSEIAKGFDEQGFAGSQAFVYQIMAELDEDLSGGIDFEEFIRLVTTKPPEKTSKHEIQKIFRAFDPNKQGKFGLSELKRVAGEIGEELQEPQFQRMLRNADLDNDGFITEEDFYNIMTGRVYWGK